MNAPPELVFRASDHTYWLGEERLPSVSEVIAPLKNAFAMSEAARWRGTAVHLACQLDDEGDLDESSLDPELRPRLDAWRDFKSHRIGEWLAIERPLPSLRLHVAGTPDRIARMPSGHLAIFDLKSGGMDPVFGIQTAAYAEIAGEHFDAQRKRVRRFAVKLSANEKFSLHEFKDEADQGVFLACVKIWRWRKAYRR